MNGRYRAIFAVAATVLMLAGNIAEARMGRGGGFGSRGNRTWTMPPATRTAPRPAQPIERSVTPQPARPGAAQRTPGLNQTAPRGGFFNRPGLMGGLFGGLIGAGLLGMLFGNGFFGGLSGLGSVLGLVLQLALVFFLFRWAMRRFANRAEPAYAGGPATAFRDSARDRAPAQHPSRPGRQAGPGPAFGRQTELDLDQRDLDRFERLLTEIQTAYGREDIAALRRFTTPEMFFHLTEELTDNASRGQVNRVSNVKLLQGDPAESWREDSTDFATVAMRYSLDDIVEDRGTGGIIETGPSEAIELWTFRRAIGGDWLLSAIQQA